MLMIGTALFFGISLFDFAEAVDQTGVESEVSEVVVKRISKARPVPEAIEAAAVMAIMPVVEEAMALLPEEQRTAIILKEYHGMTFQEIADLSGCPLSTVKTRLYQGLAVLRRDLAKSNQ